MNVTDYIVNEIKALNLTDSVSKAKEICENFPISHIPIVDNNVLLGCFSENDIRTIEQSDEKLRNHHFLMQNFYVNEKATTLDLLSEFAHNDCNLIPVLNKEQKYIGYYDLSDILDVFANSPFLHKDSENLVVEKPYKDFSMSQVAQIVESNNAKLLGMYISEETPNHARIVLKIRSIAMNEIIQTFRRYDYTVITQHVDDEYLEQLQERADYFKKYLDI